MKRRIPPKVNYDAPRVLDYSKMASPIIQHGVNCMKSEHVGDGYLHDEGDDRSYDVDGITYCGRCHHVI